MKNLKRFVVLMVVFCFMFTGLAFASYNTKNYQPIKRNPEFYGNVYLFSDNAPLYYRAIANVKCDDLYFLQCKPVGLINKGNIVDIQITCPVERSYIIIIYKGQLYRFSLHFYKAFNNCIVWTFKGG